MKYIIASIEGPRFDLVPEYKGKFGEVYKYGSFNLLIYKGGSYPAGEYEEAYKEISDYCTKVNNELKGNQFYSGWMYAEMLTPNEQNQYNDIHCHVFHNWLVEKIITADEIIVNKINVCEKDIHDRIDVWNNLAEVTKIARVLSREMLQSIYLPGDYIHSCFDRSENNIFLKDYPIFELGWTLPYSIQIIDRRYSVKDKTE